MSHTILIADDDTDVKESTQVMLMDYGYKVITACDGKEAVTKYEEAHPDITFLDIKMPVMDGYDAFFRIKEKDPNAKIAFITGFATTDKRYTEAKKNNLLDTIHKPVGIDDLLKVINKNI